MTDLDQASVIEIAIAEGVVNVQKTFDLSIETLLLNIDIYIEATLIIAKKRRTRRVHRLNDAMRITLIQVRDALHAHFATEGYIAKLYDEERHDDLLGNDLGPLADDFFDDTSLSDTIAAAVHRSMLRSRASLMVEFAADALDEVEPKSASEVLRACQLLLAQEAAFEELARDVEST